MGQANCSQSLPRPDKHRLETMLYIDSRVCNRSKTNPRTCLGWSETEQREKPASCINPLTVRDQATSPSNRHPSRPDRAESCQIVRRHHQIHIPTAPTKWDESMMLRQPCQVTQNSQGNGKSDSQTVSSTVLTRYLMRLFPLFHRIDGERGPLGSSS